MSYMTANLDLNAHRQTAEHAAHTTSIPSLWRVGKRAYLVRRNSEHLVLIHRFDSKGAVISGGVICQLGEPVVLTLAGLGHISGWISDRCRQGIVIDFDPDPGLAQLIQALEKSVASNYVC
jgi:hypothetical protein